MWNEFKKFALKSNMIDLAIGVIIGGAVGKVVTSLVNDILMPPIGLILGHVDSRTSTSTWAIRSTRPLRKPRRRRPDHQHRSVPQQHHRLPHRVACHLPDGERNEQDAGDDGEEGGPCRANDEALPVLQVGNPGGRHTLPTLHESPGRRGAGEDRSQSGRTLEHQLLVRVLQLVQAVHFPGQDQLEVRGRLELVALQCGDKLPATGRGALPCPLPVRGAGRRCRSTGPAPACCPGPWTRRSGRPPGRLEQCVPAAHASSVRVRLTGMPG